MLQSLIPLYDSIGFPFKASSSYWTALAVLGSVLAICLLITGFRGFGSLIYLFHSLSHGTYVMILLFIVMKLVPVEGRFVAFLSGSILFLIKSIELYIGADSFFRQ